MPIAYPLTLPNTPGVVNIRWQPRNAVALQESPYTYRQKVYQWPGQSRTVVVGLPKMTIEQGKAWIAFFLSLNGPAGTFYMGDSVGQYTLGNALGKGYINGASQAGQDLETDGWQPNTMDLFKAGDWVSIADRLYTVLRDTHSDASGGATLTLWPSVQTDPADNTSVEFGVNARGVFRLTGDTEYGYDLDRLIAGISFSAVEAQ